VHYENNPPPGGWFEYNAHDGAINGADAHVTVNTQVGNIVNGTEIVNGTAINDILIAKSVAGSMNTLNAGGGNDFLFGNIGFDVLHGEDGDDFLFGGAGDLDELYGDAGNDVLNGDAGFDVLYGGDGNDTLISGAGDDVLFGDAGMDIFKYNALPDAGMLGDIIVDFSSDQGDKLDLRDLLTGFNIPGGNGNAFADGYLNVDFADSNGNTLVQVDSDGGANSFETLATLFGIPAGSIDAGDFIL
jgi:Ca2+-binding RTX toxin-like protein